MQLTTVDQYVIENSRTVVAAKTNAEIRAALTGSAFADCDNYDTLAAALLGQASSNLEYLCDLVEKLAAALAETEASRA